MSPPTGPGAGSHGNWRPLLDQEGVRRWWTTTIEKEDELGWGFTKEALEEQKRQKPPVKLRRRWKENAQRVMPTPQEELKTIPGKLALCVFCGFRSSIVNRCQRCRRKLPDDVQLLDEKEGQKGMHPGVSYVMSRQQNRVGQNSLSGSPTPRVVTSSTTIPGGAATLPFAKDRFDSKDHVHLNMALRQGGTAQRGGRQRRIFDKSAGQQVLNPESNWRHEKEPIIFSDSEEESKSSIEGGGRGDQCNNHTAAASAVSVQPPPLPLQQPPSNLPTINASDMDTTDGNFTMIKCRSVRIGSYKVMPLDKVLFNTTGIQITVPGIKNSEEVVRVVLYRQDLLKVLVHLGRSLPVIFVYVGPECARRVCQHLCMTRGSEPFFDPSSSNNTFRRVTLLPDILREDDKRILRSLFSEPVNLIDELDQSEANEILVRSSPRETAGGRGSGGGSTGTTAGTILIHTHTGHGSQVVRMSLTSPHHQ